MEKKPDGYGVDVMLVVMIVLYRGEALSQPSGAGGERGGKDNYREAEQEMHIDHIE